MVLHLGLGVWVQIGEGPIRLCSGDPSEARAIAAFESFLGCSLESFRRALDKLRSRCRICGGPAVKNVAGYPGESLTLCANNHVICCDFNESAII